MIFGARSIRSTSTWTGRSDVVAEMRTKSQFCYSESLWFTNRKVYDSRHIHQVCLHVFTRLISLVLCTKYSYHNLRQGIPENGFRACPYCTTYDIWIRYSILHTQASNSTSQVWQPADASTTFTVYPRYSEHELRLTQNLCHSYFWSDRYSTLHLVPGSRTVMFYVMFIHK